MTSSLRDRMHRIKRKHRAGCPLPRQLEACGVCSGTHAGGCKSHAEGAWPRRRKKKKRAHRRTGCNAHAWQAEEQSDDEMPLQKARPHAMEQSDDEMPLQKARPHAMRWELAGTGAVAGF
jgi:hypothetical protein